MEDFPDPTARLAARAEEMKAKAAKKKSTAKKTKDKTDEGEK